LRDAELELWRDNLDGALRLLRDAYAQTADPRYARRVVEIRSWMRHLATPSSYAAAYEHYYHQRKSGLRFKILERNLRILFGRKTRKTVRRIAEYPEYTSCSSRRSSSIAPRACSTPAVAKVASR